MFCPCLPRRQRDNLLSRAFYPDQDSSGYSDNDNDNDNDDDDDYRRYPISHLRPQSYFQQQSRAEPHHSDQSNNNNPWPSNFSNGRSSSQTNRKSNPFRTLSRGDSEDGDGDGDGCDDNESGRREEGKRHHRQHRSQLETGITSFEPYRDDDSDEGDNENQKLLKENRTKKILPKMDYTPYTIKSVDDTHSTSQSLSSQSRSRPPRNPQGKMTWQDDDDGLASAEDILDVNALIAEQERITQELAKQEETLQKEEEAAIVAKRMAAIRTAERRGLLRFEGDQLVIPGGHNNMINSTNDNDDDYDRERGTVQDDGDWNCSKRIQELQQQRQEQGLDEVATKHPMDLTTSSAASSFVGGIDAFNQELKMMDLDVNRSRKEAKQPSTVSMTRNASQTRPRTLSTSVSTSAASTSSSGPSLTLPSPGAMINPRGVFNNIASFLRKVDGVIAGESEDSSDEITPSGAHQHRQPQLTRQDHPHQQTRQNGRANGPQGLNNEGLGEIGSSKDYPGVEEHGTPTAEYSDQDVGERKQPIILTTHLDSDERPYPEHQLNTTTMDSLNSSLTLNKAPKVKPEAPVPSTANDASASGAGGMLGTFSSLLSTGVSLIGYFGGGGTNRPNDSEEEYDEEYHGSRRSSTLKYGDPKKHHYNPGKKSAIEDDDDDSIDDYNF
ncbi:hypothetical protein BGZ65_006149 [Modicella reniformis]|uniref:Uncharacterized protein n=1 Tax=Modicella reniformis TaxID=1440133 RepID=A0A9P6LYF3_9FUNG|nr:hypothetical protein BGZ65_006149 [Modicella reniformis]